jgi:fatty-acyl-CoA synthase
LPAASGAVQNEAMLVTEMIRRGARHHRHRVAAAWGEERLTFEEVDLLSNRLAHALGGPVGLGPLSRLAVLLDNGPLCMALDYACVKARLTRVPINARLSADEQARMLAAADVGILVYGASQAKRARELAAQRPGLRCYGLGAGEDLMQLARRASDSEPRLAPEPDDIILALFTSGTTGTLKAVQHSQASFAAVALNLLANLVDPQPGEMALHAAPLIHASGTLLLPFWLRGGVAGILPGFDPASFLAAVERWRPSTLCLVPTMLQMLAEQPDIEAVDMSSVSTILYGASPMPRPLIERVLGLWGPRFVQFYGQTEAPIAIACLGKGEHDLDFPERLISCGRPSLECEVKLVDEQGRDLPEGEAGEIAVRAPFVMTGYLGDEALNAASFLPGGWLRTRDVGRFDPDGYLYLIERTSDMIVTGGYNVYPREVEDVLASHQAVVEAAVIGIPDDKWGEAVTAFVTLRAAAEEAELIAFCRERLADYKVPKSVRVAEGIPRSPVGKPLRRALRDPFWEGRERRI